MSRGRMGRLSPAQLRGLYNTPFERTRKLPLEASELALERVTAPAPITEGQIVKAPELVPAAPLPGYEIPAPASIRDELRYANFINQALSIGAVSTRVLLRPPSNTRRVYLMIINTDPIDLLFVTFGQDATALNGVPLQMNFGFWEFDAVVPQDDLYLIGGAAAVSAVLVYANKGIRA